MWIMNSKYVIDHKLKDNDHTSWNLMIKNVTPSDAGKYECQITSTLDYTWHVQLNVVGELSTLSLTLRSTLGNEKQFDMFLNDH